LVEVNGMQAVILVGKVENSNHAFKPPMRGAVTDGGVELPETFVRQ